MSNPVTGKSLVGPASCEFNAWQPGGLDGRKRCSESLEVDLLKLDSGGANALLEGTGQIMTTRGQMKSVGFKQAAVAGVARGASDPVVAGPGQAITTPTGARVELATVAPRFTAEETILLRGLASGSTAKEMAGQMRIPRESMYRLMSDLRRKTGASTDTALAVWVLRNMGTGGRDRRDGCR